MSNTNPRLKLRAILAGESCVSPASVYDPLSARVAESVGFELGVLSGSVVSATTLAAPDLALHTITEFADQIRRITRVSGLSLLIDADNGYGNALNVRRTIQEFEHAGAAAVSIEDIVLPTSYGPPKAQEPLVSIDEAVGKLRAAVEARRDPALVIVARTAALNIEGLQGAAARARAYASTGVDAVFIVGPETLEQVRAIQVAAGLPVIAGSTPGLLNRDDLARCGARIMMQGHQPLAAAVKALREIYTRLHEGHAPASLTPLIASSSEMAGLLDAEAYEQWLRAYVHEA